MTRKKKTVIIVAAVMLVIAVSATVLITVTRNKKSGVEAENAETAMLGKEDLSNSASEEQEADANLEGNNQISTEEAEKPTTESGSTANGNKPTGGTNNTPSQTTVQSTTQAPNTTEQPTGGNQGGGTHQHTWQAQYRTVHHDEEGHYENVCVKEAYDEPIYEGHYACDYCGKDITASGEGPDHCIGCGPPMPEDDPFYMPGVITTLGSGYGTIRVQVETIHHEAVYEKKWIVDKKAYDEQVLDGYKCTTCGAIK
ncbi:MAG: hypothetical protein NC089_02580 [Bacteroides sp.]|nr:hypothetical protein [Bacteroides sp.]MCM1550093.1 hypothetical protein [Clostridium sp.]